MVVLGGKGKKTHDNTTLNPKHPPLVRLIYLRAGGAPDNNAKSCRLENLCRVDRKSSENRCPVKNTIFSLGFPSNPIIGT